MLGYSPIKTRTAFIYKDKNGIIIITMINSAEVDEYDVLDNNLVIRNKCGNKPCYKLLDARATWSLTDKAKEYAESEDSIKRTKARAIVVSSRLKSTLLNFLRRFNKKEYPQRIFTDWDKAYNWLLNLKRKTDR